MINMEKYVITPLLIKIPRQITPNMITVLNLVLINILCFFKLYKTPVLFSIGLFIYYLLDKIDGLHAIATQQVTGFGEILDKCVDGYSVVLVTYMLFDLFSATQMGSYIRIYPILIMIMYMFDIPYLTEKCSNYRLHEFTTNDVTFFSILIPLFKYITIPEKIITHIVTALGYIWLLYIGVLLIQLFSTKINVVDIILLMLIGCLYFVRNIYLLSLFNGLIILYIMTSTTTGA